MKRLSISAKLKSVFCSFIVIAILLQSTVSTPSLKTLGVGSEAPDFLLLDLEGTHRNFSSILGDKLTLLIFWATWSNQSEKALRHMEELYRKYRHQGLSVVGINVEKQVIDRKNVAVVAEVADRLQLSFPVLVDHGLNAFHSYGVIAVPTTILIDKNQKIQFEMSGWPITAVQEMNSILAAHFEGEKVGAKEEVKVDRSPENKADRYCQIGVKALKSKRTEKGGVKWLKKAISADPDYILPYLSLGAYYHEKGEKEAAREQYEKAVKLQPNNSRALGGLALILLQEENYSAAQKRVESALDADKTYTPGYYYLGYLKGRQGEVQHAQELFNRAEEINPLDYRIHLYRGRMFEERNNLGQAVENYKKALELILHLE